MKEPVRITSWDLPDSEMETQRCCRKEQHSPVSSGEEDREQICRLWSAFPGAQGSGALQQEGVQKGLCPFWWKGENFWRVAGGIWDRSQALGESSLKICFELLEKVMGQGMHFSWQSFYFFFFSFFLPLSLGNVHTIMGGLFFLQCDSCQAAKKTMSEGALRERRLT